MSAMIREALEPFATASEVLAEDGGWEETDVLELIAEGGDREFVGTLTVGDLRRARTAFEAIPSEGTVKVRALVWQSFEDTHWAESVVGTYNIEEDGIGQWRWTGDRAYEPANSSAEGVELTLEEAKAAAQADYERRVLACLAPTLSGEAEAVPVGEAVTKAAASIARMVDDWYRSRVMAVDDIPSIGARLIEKRLQRFFVAHPAEEPGEVARLTRERDAARDALAKIHRGCRWYWPAEDTEASVDSAQDAYEQACGGERYDGTVAEIARGGIVETTWCAALPAADDSDSDDDFWIEEATEAEAQAKIDAERQRRAALTGDAQEAGR